MTNSPDANTEKRKQFPIKIEPSRLAQFTVAANWRGTSRASLLHQFISKTIHEERTKDPQRFDQEVADQLAKILARQSAGDLEPAGFAEEATEETP